MHLFLEVIAMFIFYSLFAFSILVSILGLINLILIKKYIIYYQNNSTALVSVLIPARKRLILKDVYIHQFDNLKKFKIIVLDDVLMTNYNVVKYF